MRRNRLIVLGLLILSLLAISFYGGPVSYGFFFFMLATPIISAIYAAVIYFRFRIYQKIDAKVLVAEEPVTFYFTLQNENLFAFAGIRTDFYSDYSSISGLDPDIEYELFPHKGIEKETRLVCKYKGEYEVGIKHVIVRDFLKILEFKFKNDETITVNVIPRLVILDKISVLENLAVTSKDSHTNLSEPDVLVRNYIPGDDIRSINWKLTAATGKPMVRNRIGENTPAISIIMDSFRISSNPDEFLPSENKVLETTIALAYYYIERGIHVYVYSYEFGPRCYALETPDDFEAFYNKLSYFSFDNTNTAEKLFGYTSSVSEIGKSSAVIFVMQKIDDAYIIQLNELKKCSASTATCLITKSEITNSPNVLIIGYDDDLKEVLA